ncbi:MAG: Hsp70 family protein [Byssovorax sp.]
MQTTIDIGIDLGTTNSGIARQDGAKPRLIASPGGHTLLPSCVHVTAAGKVLVGAEARAFAKTDPDNTALEFKRLMGTDETRPFPASKARMTPEELSAAVLRELLGWAAADSGGAAPRAAVITIPAMFQLPQCEATRRAAELAGITLAPLLQEPIAAAIAHSGAGETREGYWLVYDLGGGTFDVSLVRSRGGRLQVLDHGGDNHLGGRDFDRVIAREALDRARNDGKLKDFKRSDPAFASAMTRLRLEAERVRIQLSKEDQATFLVDDVARDAGGSRVDITFPIDRPQMEKMIDGLVLRTTSMCEELLRRNRLAAKELNGLVMVGGPTLTPCVPRLIEAKLGVEARHFLDPMSIVATGAALFASTQKLPTELRAAGTSRGAVELGLEYEAMTTDPEPLLAIRPAAADAARLASLRVIRDDGGYDSGPIHSRNGAFVVDLKVRENALNLFRIEALGVSGAPEVVEPAQLTILHGFSVAKPPLSQSVGIMLADNTVSWYLRKSAVLPARNTMTHATTVALARGQTGEAIHVPLVQGESSRADRNKVIGILRIVAEKLGRDLPVGSEVQVTMSVDESSRTTGRAYVPLLDQWFDEIVLFRMETKDAAQVGKGLSSQKDRLAELESMAEKLEGEAKPGDSRVAEIEALIEEGDRDALDLADQMVRWMSDELDRAEDEGHAGTLRTEFAEHATLLNDLLTKDDVGERRQIKALSVEFERAMAKSDFETAKAKVDSARQLATRVLRRHPGYWRSVFKWVVERVDAHGLRPKCVALIAKGERHVAMIARNENAESQIAPLSEVCAEMARMLPADEQDKGASSRVISHVK